MVIWFEDCTNGLVTKVNLSEARKNELEQMDDVDEFICKYADKFGINPNSSSWMVTDSEDVYEVDF